MFDFQHSQNKQLNFEQLAQLLLTNPMVYARSKLEVG